jgi:hypothetical protein
MQDLLRLLNRPIVDTAFCDVISGKFSPHIMPYEANNTMFACDNPFRKNIVTCKDPKIDDFITEVGGLEFNVQLSPSLSNLPTYIPIFDSRTTNILGLPSDVEFIGVTLRDVVRNAIKFKAGMLQESNNIQFRTQIISSESFNKRKAILFLTGPDTLIEWIWWKRIECDFFKEVSQLGFLAATGFNFSVIGDECAFSQVLNQKKSLVSARIIEENGLLAIPHIYVLTQAHIDRWSVWLINNPTVKLFCINCQLQKSVYEIDMLIRTTIKLLQRFPYLHVLLQGFRFPHIKKLGPYLERIHFSDAAAVKYAQFKKRFDFVIHKGSLSYQFDKNMSLNKLISHNILNRRFYIEYINGQILNSPH